MQVVYLYRISSLLCLLSISRYLLPHITLVLVLVLVLFLCSSVS